jgi:hypothetical protein
LETREELECVNALLERSFPKTVSLFRRALQDADPLDIVYDGNPDEYADVVREAVALLSWQSGDPRGLDSEALRDTLLEALRRCFDEEPDPRRVESALRLIREGLGTW